MNDDGQAHRARWSLLKNARTSSAARGCRRRAGDRRRCRRSVPRGTIACGPRRIAPTMLSRGSCEVAQRLAVKRGRHLEFQDAALAFFEHRQQARLSALDLVEHRGNRGAARRQRDVDADALEQPQVGGLADPGDDAPDAELPAEQRRQQVPLVVVDHRDQHVAACRCPRSRAARDRCRRRCSTSARRRRGGEHLAARGVALDHAELYASRLSSRSASRSPTSPPPMIVDASAASRSPPA